MTAGPRVSAHCCAVRSHSDRGVAQNVIGTRLGIPAYSFLAPGGGPYDPKKALREQLGMKFGHRSALSLYAYNARQQHRKPPLSGRHGLAQFC